MGLISWLAEKFGGKSVKLSGEDIDGLMGEYKGEMGELFFRELALTSAVNLIASAVAKCEFKTFQSGKEYKGREYWLWNYEPNQNQNSSQFIRKWIQTLYLQSECLIISWDNQLLVADSFIRKPFALYEDVFTQVTVGDMTFNQAFYQSDVLYYRMEGIGVRTLIDGICAGYSRLLSGTMKSYAQNRHKKGIFKYKSLPVAGSREYVQYKALVDGKISEWLNAEKPGALPLGEGQDWQENAYKTYSQENTRDIRAMVDDISDFTAKALGIPPALLRGDVAGVKDALDQFLTFCVDPLCDLLGEEINRKRFGFDGFRKGSFLKIDTKAIRHVDLLNVATAVDKLIGSGAFTINDIRRLVDEQPVEGGDQHYITRNYDPLRSDGKPEGGE